MIAHPKVGSPFVNESGIEFTWIPPGIFNMGSHVGFDVSPVREVTIGEGFFLGTYPVTQSQWERVVGGNPSKFKGAGNPVERVSWFDCSTFLEKLNPPDGWVYRLPSEAEWEYAARAGSASNYFFGDDDLPLGDFAWFSVNSSKSTHPVGEKQANPFGIYDILGNVWEWCEDWYGIYDMAPADGRPQKIKQRHNSRVLRGGAWRSEAAECSVAVRYRLEPGADNELTGCRICLARID